MPTPRAIILFDGVCNLCNGAVRFIIERDPRARFAFAPLQSAAARAVLEKHGAPTPLPDSMVLIEGGRVYVRSAAVLRIARGLRFPWRLACALAAVPRPLRDWAYRLIARSRYRWFGKSESCMVPTPELRARFLS
jgi:predicted DCC family thiol-disulfide oxidoreductase YuxK